MYVCNTTRKLQIRFCAAVGVFRGDLNYVRALWFFHGNSTKDIIL